jgi:putative colanic acid biosysnthesis UDP-glucose lipid carrier transferase
MFFVQLRNGLYGRAFHIYKLRTMYHTTNQRIFNTKENYDNKITPIGKVLRYLSIDELPQLWNVVKGDMAIIGPRPHPIELDLRYLNFVPDLLRRYSVKPGMTGLAQIQGARGPIKNVDDMIRRLNLDQQYIKTHCFALNLSIFFKTIFGGFINGRFTFLYWTKRTDIYFTEASRIKN